MGGEIGSEIMKDIFAVKKKFSFIRWYDHKQIDKYLIDVHWHDFVMDDSEDFINFVAENRGWKFIKKYIKKNQQHFYDYINDGEDDYYSF